MGWVPHTKMAHQYFYYERVIREEFADLVFTLSFSHLCAQFLHGTRIHFVLNCNYLMQFSPVLVHLGCCNNIAYMSGLGAREVYFLRFWRLPNPRSYCGQIQCLVRPTSPLMVSLCPHMVGRDKVALWGPFVRTLIPFRRTPDFKT